ncbi:hypothetical protein M2168_003753 [Streptomyces sp. CZ24]|uniref:hypothetical protein n=1 Tax=Streptomyces TaxID=1883 RepID=UPI0004CC3319|nr:MULTISPECIES: hypothetical protein [Streptomyces]MBL0799115.1 hypothetical protein [Streptomyces albidoflavus]MCG5121514.1 hypothetical protein [Streptomyces sp. T7(2022)]MCK2142900.1 hypothetical protein [Streptomyces sp. WAC00276]MDH6190721.1 hypothetical protein [Streptomyces sp. CZ24]
MSSPQPDFLGPDAAYQATPQKPGKPRRPWRATLVVALLLPPVLLGSGWLAQSESTLLLLLGVVVALAALLVAWAYAGAGPGTFVAVLGFAFMLFVGPAMGETVLDRHGVRTPAVVAGFGEMSARYDRARTCKLVWEDRDTGEIGRVETGGLSACTDDIKAGDPAVVVVDPTGWQFPRMAADVKPASTTAWAISGGLCVAMELMFLWGRARKFD